METLKITYESVSKIIQEKIRNRKSPAIATSLEVFQENQKSGIEISKTQEELNLLCKSNTLRFGRTLNGVYFYINKIKG